MARYVYIMSQPIVKSNRFYNLSKLSNMASAGPVQFKGRKLNKRQKRQVKRLIGVQKEYKFFVYNLPNNSTTSSTPGITSISNIPQGTTDNTRDGDRLTLAKYIEIRMQFTNSKGTGGDWYNTYRFILFQWKGSNTPISSDILLVGPSGSIDVHSSYDEDQALQYHIIKDICFNTVGPTDTVSGSFPQSNHVRNFVFKIPVKRINKKIQFVGGTTTGSNKLYYLLVTDSTAAPHPTYWFNSKIYFTDA